MLMRIIRLAVGFALLLTACSGGDNTRSESTQVLVVGTIHGGHRTNLNYSHEHLAQILATYDPDAICVEIRPKDFRHVPYLTEMVAATIYGSTHGKRVYAIDWWDEQTNARSQRDSLMKTADYVEKHSMEEALVAANTLIRTFEEKHGDWQSYTRTGSYVFFNGEEYNDYIAEGYRISMEVWGDSPMNLYYRTRNDRMLDLIRDAIRENRGRKVIVLTGAEHKHYFDRALAMESGVALVTLSLILPLEPVTMDPAVEAYLTENRAAGYYDISSSEGLDLYYAGALTSLVHGPDMDFDPGTVPAENIAKARLILDEWQATMPDSPLLHFNLGWLHLLQSAPAAALEHFEKAAAGLDGVVPYHQDGVRRTIHRNMGLCYDLIGDRERAIASYEEGERMFDESDGPAWMKEAIFGNYRTVPFRTNR